LNFTIQAHFKKKKKEKREDLKIRYYTSSKWATGGKGLAVGNNTRIITREDEVEPRALEKRRERKCVESKRTRNSSLGSGHTFSLSLSLLNLSDSNFPFFPMHTQQENNINMTSSA
jgi:hypothetical protein